MIYHFKSSKVTKFWGVSIDLKILCQCHDNNWRQSIYHVANRLMLEFNINVPHIGHGLSIHDLRVLPILDKIKWRRRRKEKKYILFFFLVYKEATWSAGPGGWGWCWLHGTNQTHACTLKKYVLCDYNFLVNAHTNKL